MKICLVHNLYADEARGGAEKIVNNLAIALTRRKHMVTILTTHNKNTIENISEHEIRIIKVPSSYTRRHTFSQIRRLLSHIFGFINIRAFARYASIFSKEQFDIVWVHNSVGFGMVLYLALHKATLLQTYHDIQFLHPSGLLLVGKEKMLDSIFARIYRFLIRIYTPHKLTQLFPSQWLEDLYRRYGISTNNSVVLRNPSPDALPQPIMGDGPDFLFVGQLEPHKGPELLLESFVQLARRESSLWLIGDGSLGPVLIKKYIQKNIRFLGRLENPLPYIASARCLVVPSLCYENLPTVILEAARYKTLAIGSRLGGIVEALGDQSLSFEPTQSSLEQKLHSVLENGNELKNCFLEAQKKHPPLTADEYLATFSARTGISV